MMVSAQFKANERRRAFLEYVVEEALAGRADQIKGFSVAVAALNRDENFDPSTDPVVRLEARRLRREMEHYYLTDGFADPVVINIPKGSYVPTFRIADTAASSGDRDGPIRPALVNHPRRIVAVMLAVALFAVAAIGATLAYREYAQTDAPNATTSAAWGSIPVVAVLPFEPLGESAFTKQAASGLAQDVITDLTHISGLRVLAHNSTSKFSGDSDLNAIQTALGASHILRGSLQSMDAGYRLNVSLIDTKSQAQIWAGRFDYTTELRFDTQTEIAKRISQSLSIKLLPGQSDRIELSRWKRRDAQMLYSQGLTVMHPPSDPTRIDAAIGMLKRVIALEPKTAHGYGGLAFVEAHRLWYGHALDTRESHSMIQRLADRALSIDPGNVRALVGLSLSAMIRGDSIESVDFARKAVEAQPSSGYANAYLAVALIFARHPEMAITSVQVALHLDPANPRRPYLNILAVALFHAGDYRGSIDAYQEGLERGGPYGPTMMAYHAAAHAALGEEQQEQEILRRLIGATAEPSSFTVEGWLRRASNDERYIAPLLAELRKAEALE